MDKIHAFDYTYMMEESEEFKNLRIEIRMEEKKMQLFLCSEHELTRQEIEHVLNELQDRELRKMRIRLADEVRVFVQDPHGQKEVRVSSHTVIKETTRIVVESM